MIKFDFAGKRILVTGASSGIGEAISKTLVGAGADVIMVARNEEKLTSAAESIGVKSYYSIDLSDVPSIGSQIEAIIKECGPLDGFVHSAGIGTVRPIKMCTYDYMKQMMDVNFFSFI